MSIVKSDPILSCFLELCKAGVAFFFIKDFFPHIFYNVIMMFQNLNDPV
jgi:hypothetical protein